MPFSTSRARTRGLSVLGAVAAAALIATPAAGARDLSNNASAPGSYYAKNVSTCPAPSPGKAGCFAMRRQIVSSNTPGAKRFVTRAAPAPGPAGGLTPASLASGYGYATTGGTGQTIGIVDAYNDPNIEADLGTFNAQYGLPACTKANGCLKVVGQTGSTTSLPANDTTGWSTEITLDVEAAHAVCPKCKIVLVETNSSSYSDLATGVNQAVAQGSTVVSNSYGGPESGAQPSSVVAAYNHPGVVITASTGDHGYFDWDFINSGSSSANAPSTPASLNTVVAVGGTALNLSQSGARGSETVWNDNGPKDYYGQQLGAPLGAGGSGCSTVVTARGWQTHVPGWASTLCGTKRLNADIAAVGDSLTGFDIYDSYSCSSGCYTGWNTFGGTSLASPVIASMWALAGGSGGVQYPAVVPYGHLKDTTASLYDVTVGGTGFCGGLAYSQCSTGSPANPNALGYGLIDCEYTSTANPGTPSSGTGACDAQPGYDGPSGVGTPIGLTAFKPIHFAYFTAPATATVNTPVSFNASTSKSPYPGATIKSYTWAWGDGSASTVTTTPTTTHTFTHTGTFTVTMTATDSYGTRSPQPMKITVS